MCCSVPNFARHNQASTFRGWRGIYRAECNFLPHIHTRDVSERGLIAQSKQFNRTRIRGWRVLCFTYYITNITSAMRCGGGARSQAIHIFSRRRVPFTEHFAQIPPDICLFQPTHAFIRPCARPRVPPPTNPFNAKRMPLSFARASSDAQRQPSTCLLLLHEWFGLYVPHTARIHSSTNMSGGINLEYVY